MRRAGALLLAVLALSGCGRPKAAGTADAGGPPAPEVGAVTVAAADVPVTYEYAGRVTAFRRTEVRARVGGLLLERRYVEGSRVAAGSVLFRIDPAPWQAALAHAAAALQQAQATRDKAARDLERANALMASPAGSRMTRDDAQSSLALGEAAVASARADVQTAGLNVSWTTVTAPLDGVTSLEALPEGSLVETNTLLTTITQTDPIYVSFAFTDEDLQTLRAMLRDGRASGDANHLPATIVIENGSAYPRSGAVNFTDSSVDAQTGTVRGRALFANPQGDLLPGQFVRVRVGGITLHAALTVPEQSVQQDHQGAFVWVIGRDGRAERRAVALGRDLPAGPGHDGRFVIASGLAAGDRVVSEGAVKVQEGHAVHVSVAATAAAGGGGGDRHAGSGGGDGGAAGSGGDAGAAGSGGDAVKARG